MAASLLNVAHEIKLDHDNVRELWTRYGVPLLRLLRRELMHHLRFQTASPQDKPVIANTLIREMAIHSDAE
jgi:hypothetical protein